MDSKKIAGIALLVLGAVLLVMGFTASDSVADQVSETFTGRFTDTTMWYLVGGGVCALVGLLLTFAPAGRLKA